MAAADAPIRVLFVFAWLVVGGEETEVRLLARAFDRRTIAIDVVACQRRDGMPDQTHAQLAALGVLVDTAPYALDFADTVAYLSDKLRGYDVVVACQAVPDIYPALERMSDPPPLIEHGGLVSESGGPKHLTTRYVGVCRSIRDAAARLMPGRESHALEIPSMVDLTEFAAPDRAGVRAELGVTDTAPLIGFVGRLDAKKRVEDFVRALALLRDRQPDARGMVIGGPDAFMPDHAHAMRMLAVRLGLDGALLWLGDRADVARLMSGMDMLAWLSRGEGMPHVIAEAGAARLAVIATRDNGSLQQIDDGVSGLFVPHKDPPAVAAAMARLIDDRALAARLGGVLRTKVEAEYSVEAVLPRWQALLGEVARTRRQ